MQNEIVAAAPIPQQLTSSQVVEQVSLIQHVMKSVMKEGEHFGIIPGTKKPSLLKAGAEKLCLTFRLAPFYKIERIDHQNGHREFIVVASLSHVPTGNRWGEGVGSCSTLEKKYRYRKNRIPTGRYVPKEYWNNRDQSLLGGDGFVASKEESGWMICQEEIIDNPDIAEVYNVVLKMAKKRALVDATINACAASDIFTQDLEDFKEFEKLGSEDQTKEMLKQRAKRLDNMPKDILEYFKGKAFKNKKIFEIMDENHDDHGLIRDYMRDNPVLDNAMMVEQYEEGMP